MACIERYVNDSENILNEIELRHRHAQDNAFREYLAARTIQRWFRGYITRKHVAHLHRSATTIQKWWRGYFDRKYYSRLLTMAVHKLFWDHYNKMATKIQKMWRGHYIRSHVFSYYQLKAYINYVLQKNAEFLEKSKEYKRYTEEVWEDQRQKECEDRLNHINFKLHHLVRTHQIEGVFSDHGTFEYSDIEQRLMDVKFTEYMKDKQKVTSKRKKRKEEANNYIFKGRLRECEQAWLDRNNHATGIYGLGIEENWQQQKLKERLLQVQENPMRFGRITYKDVGLKEEKKYHERVPLNRTVKQ